MYLGQNISSNFCGGVGGICTRIVGDNDEWFGGNQQFLLFKLLYTIVPDYYVRQ
jgi:hypothetical protein